jgi:hypothetical protein
MGKERKKENVNNKTIRKGRRNSKKKSKNKKGEKVKIKQTRKDKRKLMMMILAHKLLVSTLSYLTI